MPVVIEPVLLPLHIAEINPHSRLHNPYPEIAASTESRHRVEINKGRGLPTASIDGRHQNIVGVNLRLTGYALAIIATESEQVLAWQYPIGELGLGAVAIVVII